MLIITRGFFFYRVRIFTMDLCARLQCILLISDIVHTLGSFNWKIFKANIEVFLLQRLMGLNKCAYGFNVALQENACEFKECIL